MKIATSVFACVAGVLAFATLDAAAEDLRWAPWLGCWEMVRDNVREGAAVPGDAQALPPLPLVQRAAPRVCVTREGPDTVMLATTMEGQPPLEETIVADGGQHPIEDNACRGSQHAEWSKRGTRLYSQADLTCGQETRSISGLSLIEPTGTWLDIRTVRIGSRETTRVGRYRRVGEEPNTASVPNERYTLDDVEEGISRVSPRVVEAALMETKAGFRLSSRQLIELADAHVPANVIDLIVALSYPEHFVVERRDRRDAAWVPANDPLFVSPSAYLAGFGLYDDFGFLLFYSSPLSYSSFGQYAAWNFFYGGGDLVGGSDDGPPPRQPSGTGRVINGVGYTQVQPRGGAGTSGTSSGSSTASSSDGSSTASSSSGGSSGAASGGGSVSSAGFSSSGAADTGRTAIPR
jgi:hypothetical protein